MIPFVNIKKRTSKYNGSEVDETTVEVSLWQLYATVIVITVLVKLVLGGYS